MWRAECVSEAHWFEAENQAGAADAIADGFYMVSACIDWRRAYVKPRKPGGPKGRPAREKIAFDLAFELDVPLAPAVLIDRHDAGSSQANYVNASLVMFPSQQPWWAVCRALNRPGPSPLRARAQQTLARDAARGIAFDTWVGQTEHHPNHPHNIVLGWSDAESSFVLLDYEYAFGGLDDQWRGERSSSCTVAPFPDELLENLDDDELEETVGRIEALPTSVMEEIVMRIPAEFLGEAHKEEILRGLVARQSLVRTALRGMIRA